PAYADYTKRTHVAEGLQLASGAKTAIAEYHSVSNNSQPGGSLGSSGSCPRKTMFGIPNLVVCNSLYGLADPDQITGNAVKGLLLDGGGGIYIFYNSKVNDIRVSLLPSFGPGSIEWICKAQAPAWDIYVPTTCRS
ncbi:MAG: pilin, partial [Neisseriaceae bacterium]|nr:pilin [Neisseriaceae bacterium]